MRERLAELRKEMETKPKMGTDVKATSRQAPRPRLLPTGNGQRNGMVRAKEKSHSTQTGWGWKPPKEKVQHREQRAKRGTNCWRREQINRKTAVRPECQYLMLTAHQQELPAPPDARRQKKRCLLSIEGKRTWSENLTASQVTVQATGNRSTFCKYARNSN